MAIRSRFLQRAVAISLLLHAWLLLQATTHPSRSNVVPMDIDLRPAPKAVRQAALSRPEPTAISGDAKKPRVIHERSRSVSDDAPVVPASGTTNAQPVVADESEARKAYVFDLVREARRIKREVSATLPRGHAGTCEILVAVDETGVSRAAVHSSSGSPQVDDAALLLVSTSLARTPTPENLHGKAFELVLPLQFDD